MFDKLLTILMLFQGIHIPVYDEFTYMESETFGHQKSLLLFFHDFVSKAVIT